MNDLFVRSVTFKWDEVPRDSYLHDISPIRNLSSLVFSKNVTFFVGENGTGKSTLLEAIAVAFGFNAEGGTINYHFSTFDDVSSLGKSLRLVKGVRRPSSGYFFRAETFFNVATANKMLYDGYVDYHSNSHGEGFLSFMEGFDRPGLYLIDEPEAALSQQRQLALLRHIHALAKNGSQFLIATHSPILLGLPGAEILSFDGDKLTSCAYEETASYRLTKLFLEHKELILNELLKEDET